MRKNISLIGMPGCGKSVIGNIASKKLKLNFYDLDEYIEGVTGKTINMLFENGEEYFRNIETDCLKIISKKENSIISTGGGIIKKDCNIKILKENSVIIFINRSPSDIVNDVDIKKRPLLANGTDAVYKLYDERINIYKKACDYEIINNKNITDVCDMIINIYKGLNN